MKPGPGVSPRLLAGELVPGVWLQGQGSQSLFQISGGGGGGVMVVPNNSWV